MTTQPVTAKEVGQEVLLPALLDGADPDLYLVIPVDVLSRQLSLDWDGVAREHRGEVRMGWLQMRHLRSLQGLGFIVDTKHTGNGMDTLT